MIYKINIDLLKNKIKKIILNQKWEDVPTDEAERFYEENFFLNFDEIARDVETAYYNGNGCYEFRRYLNKECRQVFKLNSLNSFIFGIIDFDEVGEEEEAE